MYYDITGLDSNPKEDTVEYMEEIGFKHLFNENELIDLAKDNAETDEELYNLKTLEDALKILKYNELAVIRIER